MTQQLRLPLGERLERLDRIVMVRHRRARRYILRVQPDGTARVTIPRWGSKRDALAFAERHAAWIAREREARRPPTPASDAIRRGLRRLAAIELPERLHRLAAEHGLTVGRVSVRDQRTRWGSCGASGHITLNWRLVLMPAFVRDYVLVHELMHLVEPNHSPRFWRRVAAVFPRVDEARAWLRREGRTLWS